VRLIDSHGRAIRDLRLSITDRCNFRCVYCMEPDARFMPESELLSVEEMIRLAGVCVSLGVHKIRLTGGEPTVHPRLTEIIAGVAALGDIDLAITTNGALVDEERLHAWKAAGLRRVTISIDGVDPARFAAITRSRTPPSRVINAAAAAVRAGFQSTKLNAVVVRGYNDDQVVPLAGLARSLGLEMRFIEFMPLDAARAWDRSRLVPAAEILEQVNTAFPLAGRGRDEPSSTSETYAFADGAPGRIGVIAPVTNPFCGACSRLRITADGKVRPCLFSRDEWDIRPILRQGDAMPGGDHRIARFLADATWTKQAGHGISAADFTPPPRSMHAIGG
jgi:cyclic pyranopterin phosphate synthase